MNTPNLVGITLAACAALALPARADRVVLKNGGAIEATLTEQTEDAVTLDLGFQTLSVPRDQIAILEVGQPVTAIGDEAPPAIAPIADPLVPAAPARTRLYHEAIDLSDRNLDANVKAVGEAVVLVRSPVGLGSGFVIHKEGYVITNDHVVAGSTELTVIVFRQATDGLRKDEYSKVRIVATSELHDLALIKIEPEQPEEFLTVPLGESLAVSQGQPVFAVGNPMGLERSLSEGIVSLKSRLLGGQTYVQTTTAISPGNSGGPLFNMRGEVIGVNTLKIVSSGAEGLGFSIPVNRVKAFVDDQEAFAFDPLNANTGFRYYRPPQQPAASNQQDAK